MGGGALIYTGAVANPLFYLIMLSGAYSTTSRLFGWGEEDLPSDYHRISTAKQAELSAAYLGARLSSCADIMSCGDIMS